ncbi:hypothetical protein BS47DRAFT_1389970 [Hydnum rufescens UP504]|uniref:Uncharacterized protein n=1 Tax=Hydnum rufescens UP504 TaxID=1448309 RepID=A0A9P6DW70_9AGAM|nr:hypothetical protein BS47DRAFT_1389970 [Hydnum rufescens UP504]
MKSKTKKLTVLMDSSIPSTVGASSSSIVPSASSSRGMKKFLSFKKKSEVSLPAPPPNPIELNDDGQPSQWQFACQPMKKSTYHLDWYFDNVWLRNIRNLIVDAFELHQLWFGATEFFNLRLNNILTSSSICGASDVIDSLIQSGCDGALPTPSSFSKFHMPLEVIKLEDAEAQLRAVSRLLMHRTIDHIALIAGLELP